MLHSAFSHAGQKCSATSLLLLENEVYHDERFRHSLIDAITSIEVGSAWKLSTKMGPLIRPPADALLRGLKELESGENWAIMPRMLQDNPCLYSPGVKWDVTPGSFTHMTELFGPVLGVMPYRNLNEAISLVHQTGYGLTSGLESLDDREQQQWSSRLRAGNLYINRPTTGAIVLRQPFGGLGKSAFGPGIKAGGPNYVLPLMHHRSVGLPRQGKPAETQPSPQPSNPPTKTIAHTPALQEFWNELNNTNSAAGLSLRGRLSEQELRALAELLSNYDGFAREEIAVKHDTLRLIGQDNLRVYLPLNYLRIRVTGSDTPLDIIARIIAAKAVGGRSLVSAMPGVHKQLLDELEELTHAWGAAIEFIEENDQQLIMAIDRGQVDRLRYADAAVVPLEVRAAAGAAFIYVADAPFARSVAWSCSGMSKSKAYASTITATAISARAAKR